MTIDYADATGLLEHRMTVRFETVKYKSGLIDGDGPSRLWRNAL